MHLKYPCKCVKFKDDKEVREEQRIIMQKVNEEKCRLCEFGGIVDGQWGCEYILITGKARREPFGMCSHFNKISKEEEKERRPVKGICRAGRKKQEKARENFNKRLKML